ncbi:ATPase [Candidatus Kuenenbacteria bacterium HGW-Kuenenbacteria-1]|uniref:ATPase n=1 Tax=Candidatus Kuenenbacteria bacterium HGW-Kuenenbacteria-1 TaxID=2013812 RepID=A0A2N1UNB5_9BACT|nr:MAG: ATPase [Candidatus Kuenenbacteria bacterium HGW-Kuenenbacteria-1]
MEKLIPRLFKMPKQSFFLFGPRGTGKSTLLKQIYPNALWIDLLEPDIFRSYSSRPERLKEIVLAYPKKKIIIIDEIQKIPELLNVVHLLIEKKINKQFILTGSSSRKLKRTGVNLLAGRLLKKTLYPFVALELGKKFNIKNALTTGLLPLVITADKPLDVLKSYIALYVREEVQMEGLVRNIGNFSRFLEAISFSHGSMLNTSNVARECEVERKTVEGYITILEDLLLAHRIPVFVKRAKRAVIAHSKFYYFDTGVFCSLRPSGPLDKPEEINGPALEGLIFQHLMAWNSYQGDENKIYFWRTKSGSEVDFIIYGEKIFWAIEVKNSDKIRPEDLRALKTFKLDYPECKAYFLYQGKERIKKHGILCLPCEEFLLSLNPSHSNNIF